MAQSQGYITLDSIIYDYINSAELSQNKYFKLFHLAFECMEDLGIDFFYQIKSVKLPINSNKTITLPPDYLNYTKLGILNANGEIVPLKYNNKLTSFADLNPNRIANTNSNNFANFYSFSSPTFFNYWDGNSYTNLYGVNYNNLYGGGFKIDQSNNVILLDSNFSWVDAVLEYVASPLQGEEYFVPMVFRSAIKDWLAWKDIKDLPTTRRGSLGDKRDRRHEYFESRRRAIGKFNPFYLDQAYMASLDSKKLVVKV